MARRRKGRNVHGWLILDKPAGISSAAAVAKARWRLEARKAGHAGTLDPDATGLLAIAFGEATKTVPFVTEARKAYRFALRWGAATTTDDASGEVIARSEARPSEAEIRAALPRFTGDILQVPPQVSAVMIAGERAYARVRAGESVEIAARPLHVERLALVECPDADSAVLEMVCGKGGYVRSIGRDLGAALGCHAHVAGLRRLWSGPFDLASAVSWEELTDPEAAIEDRLLPLEAALDGMAMAICPPAFEARLRNGNPLPLPASPPLPDGAAMWVSSREHPLAIGRWTGGLFHPERVFVYD